MRYIDGSVILSPLFWTETISCGLEGVIRGFRGERKGQERVERGKEDLPSEKIRRFRNNIKIHK